ncbi:MAG: opacity protein-like surface antigen [Planctomycetota bacterium]|jgi:opacity protein-like surface antigen
MKKSILTIVLVSIAILGFSQRKKGYKRPVGANQEIGIALGVSNYLGDLAWKGDIPIIEETNPAAFRPAGGFYYRNNFTNFTSFKASFSLGGLYGNDAETNGDLSRLNRNLHFRSIIADIALMLEWNILPYRIGDKRKWITPYIGVGVAGFYNNPQAELNGRWVDLQPLGTEGQGILPGTSKYSIFNFAVPASLGMKVNISKKIALGLEFQYRYTFTDYIDDVSQGSYITSNLFYENNIPAIASDANALAYRAIDETKTLRFSDKRGSPEANDHYYFVMFSLSYKIGKSNVNCPTFR